MDKMLSNAHADSDLLGTYMPITMIVRYGENKEFYVNPNAGFASVMQYIRAKLSVIGVSDDDHLELCDEDGKLINQGDFPNMIFMTSFIKPGSDEATFIPAKVERDEHKKVTKIDVLLKDPEHNMPEIYTKLKKEYHIHNLDMKAKRKEKAETLSNSTPTSPKDRGHTLQPHNREISITGKTKTAKSNRHSKERSKEDRRESLLKAAKGK